MIKNDYVTNIHTRRGRIEKYKTLYGENSKRFEKQQKINLRQIEIAQRKIDKIKEQEERVRFLADKIKDFLDLPRWGYKVKLTLLAKRLFYRWGAENGIRFTYLQIYAGSKPSSPCGASARMLFIKKCQVNPEQRELWERFKLFMKESSNQLG